MEKKTLDQYLQEYGTGDLALPKHIEEVKKAARTWITQYIQNIEPCQRRNNVKALLYLQGEQNAYNKLLVQVQEEPKSQK